MAKLYITIGDDDNKNFKREITLEVSGTVALVIKDRCNTTSADEYESAWDKMCDEISSQYPELPRNWYVYSIER